MYVEEDWSSKIVLEKSSVHILALVIGANRKYILSSNPFGKPKLLFGL